MFLKFCIVKANSNERELWIRQYILLMQYRYRPSDDLGGRSRTACCAYKNEVRNSLSISIFTKGKNSSNRVKALLGKSKSKN